MSWNGMFMPPVMKAIDNIEFKPIVEMTFEDWRTLDYRNLRAVAKDRIADALVDGDLLGFFMVDVVEKARSKPRYFWPVSAALLRVYRRDETAHKFFRNEGSDDDFQNDNSNRVDDLIDRLVRKFFWGPLISIMIEDSDDEKEELEKLSDGRLDSLELRDAALALAAYLYRVYSADEVDKVLDRVDPDYELA